MPRVKMAGFFVVKKEKEKKKRNTNHVRIFPLSEKQSHLFQRKQGK